MSEDAIRFDFADAGVRRTDPPTARAAALELIATGGASILEGAVLIALHELGGTGTSEEVADHMGFDLQSISPRFRPLARKGRIALLRDENFRAVARPGKSGRKRQVWTL